jgi:hypothetical protein
MLIRDSADATAVFKPEGSHIANYTGSNISLSARLEHAYHSILDVKLVFLISAWQRRLPHRRCRESGAFDWTERR